MDQTTREGILRVRRLEGQLPLELWLAMVTDSVGALVPTSSSLLRELGGLAGKLNPSSPVQGEIQAFQPTETDVRRQVNAVLDNIDSLIDLYKPYPNREQLFDQLKEGLSNELDRSKRELTRELDFAISDRVFRHWTFKILSGLLIALIAAFLGIDIMFSQKVAAAQQRVAEMQGKLDSANLAIFEKSSELDKDLDTARRSLNQKALDDVKLLQDDADKDMKDIDWVKGKADDQIKIQGDRGSGSVASEETKQVGLMRKAAAEKIVHMDKPWAIWMLSAWWVIPSIAMLLSVVSLIISVVVWRR